MWNVSCECEIDVVLLGRSDRWDLTKDDGEP